jgi:hypothetical protein
MGISARMDAKGTVCRKKATSADYWFTGFLVARPFLKVLPRPDIRDTAMTGILTWGCTRG